MSVPRSDPTINVTPKKTNQGSRVPRDSMHVAFDAEISVMPEKKCRVDPSDDIYKVCFR